MKKSKKETIEPFYKTEFRAAYSILACFLIISSILIMYTILLNDPRFVGLLIFFKVAISITIILQFHQALRAKYPKKTVRARQKRKAKNIFAIESYYKVKLRSAYIDLGVFIIGSSLIISFASIANSPSLTVGIIIFELLTSTAIILQFSNAYDHKHPKNKEKDSQERKAIKVFARILFRIEGIEDNIPRFKRESFSEEEEFTLLTILTELNQIKEKFRDFDLNSENVDIDLLNELLDNLMLLEIKLGKLNSNLHR